MDSTLDSLPPPKEIHRELILTLDRVATLRKLLRLSQRVFSARIEEKKANERNAIANESEVALAHR